MVFIVPCVMEQRRWPGNIDDKEKYLGVPSYADRDITGGSIYHVLMYGKNAMGSHAGQVNAVGKMANCSTCFKIETKPY